MKIERGYWNYYMSFQLASSEDIMKCIEFHQFDNYVVASYMEGNILSNTSYENSKDEDIQEYLKKNISLLHATGKAVSTLNGQSIEKKATISLMCPLRLTYNNKENELCPVFMFLLNNGLGVMKLRVPLINFNPEPFIDMPLKKWYNQASLLKITGEERTSIHSKNEYGTVDDIVDLMQEYIVKTFQNHLISQVKNLCFETLVLSETSQPDINKNSLKREELREIYHLCYPENTMEWPTNSKLDEFWNTNHENIGGVDFVQGNPCRLLIYCEADKMLKSYGREHVEDKLEYVENSFQFSYDILICIALWKRINEMNLFDVTNTNFHRINYNNVVFNLLENELDSILDISATNAKKLYLLVSNIMTNSLNPFDKRMERLRAIEQYSKDRLTERNTLLIQIITLLGTIMFGLTNIRNSIQILRNVVYVGKGEMLKHISVNGVAVVIWIILIAIIVRLLIKQWIEYRVFKL